MLKQLRSKKTAKKIWITLAALILPAFVFWGLGSVLRGKKEQDFIGKIFGKKISYSEYKEALVATRNQAIIQFGDKYSEMQQYLNLEAQAWERLILLEEAKKHKIKAGDQEVVNVIQSYPFFKGQNGNFDNRIYSEVLQYVFNTPARVFEEQIRKNILLAKLYKEVTSGVIVSDKEVEEEYRKANEEISIYYIASIPGDFTKDINPTEEELKDYFTNNSLDFKQPFSFNIEYVSSESEDKIRDIAARLNRKSDFNKIAEGFGLEIKETGFFTQLESIPGIGWSPQILNIITKLEVGRFSPVMRIDKLYYILKLKEKKEPYVPEFEIIKDKVKEAYTNSKGRNIAQDKIESCLKKLREAYITNPNSVDFIGMGQKSGLKVGTTEMFKYGSYIENIGASDIFWMVAKGLKEDDFSGTIEMSSGFFIIKLKSRVPVDNKKFEEERNEFGRKVLEQKRQEYFAKFTEELKKKSQILLYL